jgi:hypothetical protein
MFLDDFVLAVDLESDEHLLAFYVVFRDSPCHLVVHPARTNMMARHIAAIAHLNEHLVEYSTEPAFVSLTLLGLRENVLKTFEI